MPRTPSARPRSSISTNSGTNSPGARRKRPPRRRDADQKKLLEEVEAVFRGQGPLNRDATLKRWRYLATRDVPAVANARAIWEQDQWNPDAKAWRETVNTNKWETGQVARSSPAIEDWHRKHAMQSLAIHTGVGEAPGELQRLEETYPQNVHFLAGSRRRLAELEQAWPKKRLVYQQQLAREGEEIRKAKRYLGVIDSHSQHFQKLWPQEDLALRAQRRSREQDRGRGGWSR